MLVVQLRSSLQHGAPAPAPLAARRSAHTTLLPPCLPATAGAPASRSCCRAACACDCTPLPFTPWVRQVISQLNVETNLLNVTNCPPGGCLLGNASVGNNNLQASGERLGAREHGGGGGLLANALIAGGSEFAAARLGLSTWQIDAGVCRVQGNILSITQQGSASGGAVNIAIGSAVRAANAAAVAALAAAAVAAAAHATGAATCLQCAHPRMPGVAHERLHHCFAHSLAICSAPAACARAPMPCSL